MDLQSSELGFLIYSPISVELKPTRSTDFSKMHWVFTCAYKVTLQNESPTSLPSLWISLPYFRHQLISGYWQINILVKTGDYLLHPPPKTRSLVLNLQSTCITETAKFCATSPQTQIGQLSFIARLCPETRIIPVMYSVSYLTDPEMSYQATAWAGLPLNAHTFPPTTASTQSSTAPDSVFKWTWGHWVSSFAIFPMCHIGDVFGVAHHSSSLWLL